MEKEKLSFNFAFLDNNENAETKTRKASVKKNNKTNQGNFLLKK